MYKILKLTLLIFHLLIRADLQFCRLKVIHLLPPYIFLSDERKKKTLGAQKLTFGWLQDLASKKIPSTYSKLDLKYKISYIYISKLTQTLEKWWVEPSCEIWINKLGGTTEKNSCLIYFDNGRKYDFIHSIYYII